MSHILSGRSTDILDFINQSIVIISNYKILYFNNCFSQLAGNCGRSLHGMHFFEFVMDTDRNKVCKYFSSIKESGAYCVSNVLEFRFSNCDSKEYVLELSGKKIEYEGQSAILCSLNDITEKLKKTRELRRVMDSIPEVIIAFDRHHQQIVSANSATEGIYGIPAEQFEQNLFHPIDLVMPEDQDRVKEFYYGLIDTEYEKIEYRIVTTAGETKWVRDEGEVIYKEHGYGQIQQVYHFIKDITDRKQDVERLRISERKYRRIFEHSTDPIFVATADGKFVDINDAAIRLFGFADKPDALSTNISEYYWDSQERDVMIEKIWAEGSITDYPIKIRTFSGEVVEVMMTAGCKKNSRTGRFETYQAIIHDTRHIIERTELETYRRTLGGISDRLNNLIQVQVMHYGLIHDYMASIEACADEGQKVRYVDKIIEAIADSENIVSELKQLGATVRKIYHKPEPPKPVSDGTGGILFDLKFK